MNKLWLPTVLLGAGLLAAGCSSQGTTTSSATSSPAGHSISAPATANGSTSGQPVIVSSSTATAPATEQSSSKTTTAQATTTPTRHATPVPHTSSSSTRPTPQPSMTRNPDQFAPFHGTYVSATATMVFGEGSCHGSPLRTYQASLTYKNGGGTLCMSFDYPRTTTLSGQIYIPKVSGGGQWVKLVPNGNCYDLQANADGVPGLCKVTH